MLVAFTFPARRPADLQGVSQSALASSIPIGAGRFTEYLIPTVNSVPLDIMRGADGNFWFVETSSSASKFGKITPSGQITEYPIPGGGQAVAIRHWSRRQSLVQLQAR